MFGIWSWSNRRHAAALYWPTTLFILTTGALLSATAVLALGINLSSDIFLLGLFVFCALFFMQPWLALTFCVGYSLAEQHGHPLNRKICQDACRELPRPR